VRIFILLQSHLAAELTFSCCAHVSRLRLKITALLSLSNSPLLLYQ